MIDLLLRVIGLVGVLGVVVVALRLVRDRRARLWRWVLHTPARLAVATFGAVAVLVTAGTISMAAGINALLEDTSRAASGARAAQAADVEQQDTPDEVALEWAERYLDTTQPQPVWVERLEPYSADQIDNALLTDDRSTVPATTATGVGARVVSGDSAVVDISLADESDLVVDLVRLPSGPWRVASYELAGVPEAVPGA